MNYKKGLKGGSRDGFTLLELLIVISIIAILSVALVLVLNPAEALKKSRDAQRISDLNTLKTALGIYLATATSTSLGGAACTGAYNANTTSTTTLTTPSAINGSGWIPVNFSSLITGSPISNLPSDPSGYAYWYKCNATNNTFEISSFLESVDYTPKMANDGGNESGRYEVGTDLAL